MHRYLQLLIIVWLLAPLQAHAMKVPGLYEAEIPVLDQTPESRRIAVRAGLRLVLTKLTGDRSAHQKPALVPVFRLAADYVQQYRYREVAPETPDPVARPQKQLRLWMRFDETTLNRDLRNLGMPVWGKERPSTLLWLVISDQETRRWIAAGTDADLVRVIDKRASARGLAMLLPLMDLEDELNLKTSDVWGGFARPITAASSRYHADAVLTAAIASTTIGIWEGRWTLYVGTEADNWTVEAGTPEAVMEEGLDTLADRFAHRFAAATVSAEAGRVHIRITNVRDLSHYARVLTYLSSLNSVEDVQITSVAPGQIDFELLAHGGERAVHQAISLGRVLEPVADGQESDYRILP